MCCLVTSQHITFTIVNNCSDQSIWPALTGNTSLIGSPNPLTSSSPLFPKQSIQTFPIPLPWSGRIWARQFCASDGTNCLIGDCSESTCWGYSSQNTSLFEITASDLQVVYDVSLVDGFTMGITSIPTSKICETISCQVPPYLGFRESGKPLCPESNMRSFQKHGNLSQAYACLSDCSLYGLEQYCCFDDFETPGACEPSSQWFKVACPDAYSFAFDDSVLRHCELTDFTIVFGCPA
ncbi:PR5-like protein [Dactylonectria macrodidyma]|uniref:PR5-like protein n=1 Tax=Dactylonectria macrodidyma TaxID=307937 RepID=A0A9P9IUK4_9HYPO|nr:PR5-like protein [Dactylonectria macrodidyma]